MNITGKSKAAVLAALYNNSCIQGIKILQTRPGLMTEEQAQAELDANPGKYFDYLHGRVLKVDLSNDQLDTWLYDRDNGEGAASRALKSAGII